MPAEEFEVQDEAVEEPQETQVEEGSQEPEVDFDEPVRMPDSFNQIMAEVNQAQQQQAPPQMPPQAQYPTPPPYPYQRMQMPQGLPPGVPTEEEFASDYQNAVMRLGAAFQAPLMAQIQRMQMQQQQFGSQFAENEKRYMDQVSAGAIRGLTKAYENTLGRYKAYRTNPDFKQRVDGFIAGYLQTAKSRNDFEALQAIANDPDAFVGRVVMMQAHDMNVNPDRQAPPSTRIQGGEQVGGSAGGASGGKFGLPKNVYDHLKTVKKWDDEKIKRFADMNREEIGG